MMFKASYYETGIRSHQLYYLSLFRSFFNSSNFFQKTQIKTETLYSKYMLHLQ